VSHSLNSPACHETRGHSLFPDACCWSLSCTQGRLKAVAVCACKGCHPSGGSRDIFQILCQKRTHFVLKNVTLLCLLFSVEYYASQIYLCTCPRNVFTRLSLCWTNPFHGLTFRFASNRASDWAHVSRKGYGRTVDSGVLTCDTAFFGWICDVSKAHIAWSRVRLTKGRSSVYCVVRN